MSPERLNKLGKRLIIIGVVIAPIDAWIVFEFWRRIGDIVATMILGVWLFFLTVVLIAFGYGAIISARDHSSE